MEKKFAMIDDDALETVTGGTDSRTSPDMTDAVLQLMRDLLKDGASEEKSVADI